MTDLESALMRLARVERLLVASDFDGTLAPIAHEPMAVHPDEEACAALRMLAELPGTHAAIVSGRERATLRRLLRGWDDGIQLIGSHGAEMEGDVVLSRSRRQLLEELAGQIDEIAARYPGALAERKPVGVAFHYRRVAPDARERAAREVRRGPGRHPGVTVKEGRKVVELVVVEADKGVALERLRVSLHSSAIFFVGDDRTDEDAFAHLGPLDLGVKVGPGPTKATATVERRECVAPLLQRLYEFRSVHLNGSASTGS